MEGMSVVVPSRDYAVGTTLDVVPEIRRAKKVTQVLFDLEGVLFRFEPQRRLQAMSAASGIPEQRIDEALSAFGFAQACDEGRYNAQEMYQTASDSLRWYPRLEPFQEMWAQAYELDLAVWDLVRTIPAHVGRGIMTNNPEIMRRTLSQDYSEIEAHFDPVLFSSEHKLVKPDKRFYFLAARQTDCSLGEILLIDDSPENVEGAKKVGMQALLFTDAEQLAEELHQRDLVV